MGGDALRALYSVCLILTIIGGPIPGGLSANEPKAPVIPESVIHPFNGKDLSGFTRWLEETGHEDPADVFSVVDGTIHASGEGNGYLATKNAYRNYHLSIEFKWGDRTDGSGFVRNSGILLHALAPDGSAMGRWTTCIECQLAQGCEGDLIVIRGTDEKGMIVPATITSNTRVAKDGRTRWDSDGRRTVYSGRQFWWSKHDPDFQERLDTRGRFDVASPLGEWTKVECLCRDDRITVRINGKTVNECYDVFPSAGRILLQCEGNEVFFRNFELRPLSSD